MTLLPFFALPPLLSSSSLAATDLLWKGRKDIYKERAAPLKYLPFLISALKKFASTALVLFPPLTLPACLPHPLSAPFPPLLSRLGGVRYARPNLHTWRPYKIVLKVYKTVQCVGRYMSKEELTLKTKYVLYLYHVYLYLHLTRFRFALHRIYSV